MTRAELHATTGFHPDTVRALAAHLRATIPRKKATDATLIVNHEGWMNGYLDAVDAMLDSVNPEKPGKKPTQIPIYSQPIEHTNNPNRPNQ